MKTRIFEILSAVLILNVSVCICSPNPLGNEGYAYPKPSVPLAGHAHSIQKLTTIQPSSTATSVLPKCPGTPKRRPTYNINQMCSIGQDIYDLDDLIVDLCPDACKRTPIPYSCPDNCKTTLNVCPDQEICRRTPERCPQHCRPKPEVCPSPEICRRNPERCPEYCRPKPVVCPDSEICRRNSERCPEYCRPKPEVCPDSEICRKNSERCPEHCRPKLEVCPDSEVCRRNPKICPEYCRPKPEVCPDPEVCRRNPKICPEYCRPKPEVFPDPEVCRRNPERCPKYCQSTTAVPPSFTTMRPVNVNDKNFFAGGANPNQQESNHKVADPFSFGYTVNDQKSGNDYSHVAESKDDVITGEYRTLMADGRTQIVKYTSDWKHGHRVKITYEGQIIPYRGRSK